MVRHFILCFLLLAPAVRAADQPAANAPSLPAVENSVVKIFSTLRRPDLYRPWGKQAPTDITGSGVVIDGNLILTNAHMVQYASQVQVQANGSGDKVDATVVAIGEGMDLAILKLDDEKFFKDHRPVPRASVLPEVREAVFAYGYPTGGTSLSITKGIVSRIEYVPYGLAAAGLRIQVDAAINPGNSGGPAISGDKMIGLAFAHASAGQNIGYIIPNEEIDLFLADVKDGHYDGKPYLLDDTQTLENPVLRDFLKLDKSVEGTIVHHPYSSDASYPLKEWDVITKIGDSAIDNEGMVRVGPNLRVRFNYRVQQLAKDGKVPLTVVRNGKTLAVQVPVHHSRPRLVDGLHNGYPSYFVYGPIVFSRATIEFVAGLNNANAFMTMGLSGSPLLTQIGEMPSADREELVIVASPFFPHKTVKGYSNRFGAVVDSINGVRVKSLKHLVTLLRDMKDDLVVIAFAQKPGETIVLHRKDVVAATESILSDNGIRFQGTPEMLDIWNGKTTASKQ
jgi:S1-C subfamily serine protease